MPEGDTVWLAARRMHEALAGHRLVRGELRVPRYAAVDLRGRDVREVTARGKHLLTRLSGDLTLHTHFRMDGAWFLYRAGRAWTGGPTFQVRAVLATAEWVAVGYRLPVVELIPTAAEPEAVGHLGPDLLADGWDVGGEREAVRRLGEQPRRELGPALLDQRNLAGIGNLYCAETLFLRGLSPWTPVGDAGDLAPVVRLARRLMLANRAHPEQSTTGSLRRGEQHWVYQRAGRPCRRCGTPVRSAEQGAPDRRRITYWCPTCQPGPAAPRRGTARQGGATQPGRSPRARAERSQR